MDGGGDVWTGEIRDLSTSMTSSPHPETESHNVALPGLEHAMQRGWPGNLHFLDLAFLLNLSFQLVCKVGSVDVLY